MRVRGKGRKYRTRRCFFFHGCSISMSHQNVKPPGDNVTSKIQHFLHILGSIYSSESSTLASKLSRKQEVTVLT